MKSESDPQAKAIADLAAGCEGPNQFENFDRAFRATADDMRRYAGDGPILTDDQPRLEYYLSVSGDPRSANLKEVPRDLRGTIGS